MPSAVVIGSGVGGLTAALLLAARGHQVTVLEQHTRAGGLLQRFFRDGVPYDTGFHYCGGIGAGDIFGHCLKHLGIFDDLVFQPLDEDGFDRLQFPSVQFDVPVGVDNYRQALKTKFPGSADGIDSVVDAIEAAVEHYGLYRLKSDINVPALLKVEGVSLATVLAENIDDPLVRAVMAGQNTLYGVPTTQAPFGLHAMVLHHFLQGAYRIQGGGDRIALRLVKKLRASGGKIRFRCRVSDIIVKDRKALGVVLDSGEEIRADLVVGNIHPRNLLKMLPEGAVRPAYVRRVGRTAVSMAHYAAYLQVDGPVPELGNKNHYRYLEDDADATYRSTPDDIKFYYASAPGEGAVDKYKRHDQVLMLGRCPYNMVADFAGSDRNTRSQEYVELKQKWEDKLVDALIKDHPTLAPRIVRRESSTPLSTMHYTDAPEGAMYGHYHSMDQMGLYRPSQHIKVRDLLLVGQSVFAPGILGSMLSAYYGLGRLYSLEELVKELRAV